MGNGKKIVLENKRILYEKDAKIISFYRRNPCIAARDLLGINLFDAQKYIIQNSWNSSISVWCCCRDFGKSFLGVVFMLLKAMLYENQAIYIISNKGDQSKETFSKLESQVLRIGKASASIKSLTDIPAGEIVRSPTNKTGFTHGSTGYRVEFYNGSEIFTLNGIPDNFRGKRATLVFLDEAAFSTDELIMVAEAFAIQDADFATSTEEGFNLETQTRKCPTQIIYASSQDGMDKLFYKHYKNYAKQMFAGNTKYFVCDMICDVGLKPYMNGSQYKPLITSEKVEAALKANKELALREYYNQPTMDGGISQIIKWGLIRKHESFYLPKLQWEPNIKICLALDPARTHDNSILAGMNLYQDPLYGWCGEIVNCISFIDMANKKKYKLDSNRQIDEIRNTILAYNGQHPDYEYLDSLLIDQGAGGGGTSTYADGLLKNWRDKSGREHRGLIDAKHDIYEGYQKIYPDAVDKIRLLSPRKFKTQMVEEFIELMNLGVIKFPYEYSGKDFVNIFKKIDKSFDEEESYIYELSDEEKVALIQIDLMKNEIRSIHRYANSENTSVSYALAKEKEGKVFDDRFYTIIMLAHRLYELRRGQIINKPKIDFQSISIAFKAPSLRS